MSNLNVTVTNYRIQRASLWVGLDNYKFTISNIINNFDQIVNFNDTELSNFQNILLNYYKDLETYKNFSLYLQNYQFNIPTKSNINFTQKTQGYYYKYYNYTDLSNINITIAKKGNGFFGQLYYYYCTNFKSVLLMGSNLKNISINLRNYSKEINYTFSNLNSKYDDILKLSKFLSILCSWLNQVK